MYYFEEMTNSQGLNERGWESGSESLGDGLCRQLHEERETPSDDMSGKAERSRGTLNLCHPLMTDGRGGGSKGAGGTSPTRTKYKRKFLWKPRAGKIADRWATILVVDKAMTNQPREKKRRWFKCERGGRKKEREKNLVT